MSLERKADPEVTTFNRDVLRMISHSRQRGLTEQEIADGLRLNSTSRARTAREELEASGLIKELGVTRASKGKMAPVYVVTDAGRKHFVV
jgi:predicted ArsR family transcriptional regulator